MRLGIVVLTALTVATPVLAQPRALTIDDLYDPQKRIDFSGGAPAGLVWVSDTHYVWPRPASAGVDWVTVEAATGAVTPLFEAKAVSDRAAEAVGLESAVIGRALASRGLEMNPERTAAVVAIDHDLYYIPFGSNDRTQRLTSTAEAEEEFTFSPNGEFVSFLRGNDLYVVDVDHRRERRLTVDGGPQLLNGKLDWVYQEEIYGRGNYRAYWWSPTSRASRLPAARRTASARVHGGGSHPATAHRRDVGLSQAGRSEPGREAGRGERHRQRAVLGRASTATRRRSTWW